MRYKVALIGLGKRGRIHLQGLLQNPERFELSGIYDVNPETVRAVQKDFGLSCGYDDPETLMEQSGAEVLCFVTHPNVRKRYIELGIKYHVRGISLEKPMALTLQEANEMLSLCDSHQIKTVVCHQHKYLTQFEKMQSILHSGQIGEVQENRVFTTPWTAQLGTHYMDYALTLTPPGEADWAIGHVHGRKKLSDGHPSPDYLFGKVHMKNGIELLFENGYLSRSRMEESLFWFDNRISVFGTEGYVWADTADRCTVCSKATGGSAETYRYPFFVDQEIEMQRKFYKDYAQWLDDDQKTHPCQLKQAYHGFEILEGICRSALDNIRVDFPLDVTSDALTRLHAELPDVSYPDALLQKAFFQINT